MRSTAEAIQFFGRTIFRSRPRKTCPSPAARFISTVSMCTRPRRNSISRKARPTPNRCTRELEGSCSPTCGASSLSPANSTTSGFSSRSISRLRAGNAAPEYRRRVQTLAPFLHFDRDPYIVADADHYSYILDAYTTSENFPYSEAYQGLIFWAAPFVPPRSILRLRPQVTRPPISRLRLLPFARLLFRKKNLIGVQRYLLTKERAAGGKFLQAAGTAVADALKIRSELKGEDWQHESTGAKPLVLFLATSLIDHMCTPSRRCKTD